MDIENRRFLVVGSGITGLETAKTLKKLGANIIVSDIKTELDLKEQVEVYRKLQIPYELGAHNLNTFLRADKIIVSPGVPLDLPVIEKARSYGIEVIGELELAYRLNTRIKIIAITGTNGKSTTTELIGKIMRRKYKDAFIGGNLGTPLISAVTDLKENTYAVLEVSSFQIESLKEFRAEISIILNITPDHLDRYKSFDDYIKAKVDLIKFTKKSGYVILNLDDKNLSTKKTNGVRKLYISIERTGIEGAYLKNDKIYIALPDKEFEFIDISQIKLKGVHNIYNIMAAILTGILLDVEPDDIRNEIINFKSLPHRMEFITKIGNRTFINDSKSTNPDSVKWALKSFEKEKIILILGGLNKGLDFSELKDLVLKKVKLMILIGNAKEELIKIFGGLVQILEADNLKEVVEIAYQNSSEGDVILFSPGCASFDMFKNYKHRGELFKQEVMKLKNAQKN